MVVQWISIQRWLILMMMIRNCGRIPAQTMSLRDQLVPRSWNEVSPNILPSILICFHRNACRTISYQSLLPLFVFELQHAHIWVFGCICFTVSHFSIPKILILKNYPFSTFFSLSFGTFTSAFSSAIFVYTVPYSFQPSILKY